MEKILSMILSGTLALTGCTISRDQEIRARENGVLIYFNGFLSDENRKMVEGLADDLEMACFSGRRDIAELLEDAEDSRYGNHIIFHSAGSDGAYRYSQWCDSNDIDIETVQSIGAFTSHDFPDNVGEVTNYLSSNEWVFGETLSGGGCERIENKYVTNHLSAPYEAEDSIRREITERGSLRNSSLPGR